VRILLAPSIYKNKALQSGGRTHAHGMVRISHCGIIAQWCSELAPSPSSASKVLFIADAAPRAACEVLTLLTRDNGTCSMCIIKGDDITLLTHDVFVVCASMMPEPPPQRSHGYSNPLDQWAVCRFLGGKSISDHY
jgi:hypothetical protein